MAIYNEKIKVSKKEDGTFSISIKINDMVVNTYQVSKASIELLYVQLENLLK